MGKQPHVLVIPYPAQGHVTPLLKLAIKIAERGIKVTFVNAEFIGAKIMASMPEKVEEWGMIRLVSIPDGLEQGDDQNDYIKTRDTMLRVMPGHLETLIENINKSSDCEHITCVIADICVGWALELAQKMEIPRAAVLPYASGNLALTLRIPNLVEAGAIDSNGKFKGASIIQKFNYSFHQSSC